MVSTRQVRLTVNGVAHEAQVEPRMTLVDFLRGELGLTGTHVGCEHGVCGACTVLLDGRAVRSCLMLAVQADGASLMTVEGLSPEGRLHPIQEAFVEEHGLQCGFCTPGFLMSVYELLQQSENPSDEEVRDALGGQTPLDLDVTVPRGALTLGRALADRLGGAFVALDEARGACRVVLGGESPVQVDLTDFRAPTLAGDLLARDFTVNALAAPVANLVGRGSAAVEDPAGGLADLAARTVRLCDPRALEDDPVRALRAVRFALRPGWRLDPAAEPAVSAVAPRVAGMPAERVRDELIAILAEPRCGAGLRILDRLEVLPALLPESQAMRRTAQPEPHRFDVWEHSLRAVEAADALVEGLDALELERGAPRASGRGSRRPAHAARGAQARGAAPRCLEAGDALGNRGADPVHRARCGRRRARG